MSLTTFAQGSTIIVDKPLGWTSFEVVNKLRWHLKHKLGVKKIKVGHAGTLDPLATGVLVICIGKHTKEIDKLMAGEKTYTGKFLLGKTTPSFDLETEFDQDWPTEHITRQMISEVSSSFVGEHDQVPPIYSAKQIDGKRAYDIARAGQTIEMKPVRVRITALELTGDNYPELAFRVTCSKGTYIRSLANDIGKALGSGATLIELRRTASGEQNIHDAKSVDEWIEIIQNSTL